MKYSVLKDDVTMLGDMMKTRECERVLPHILTQMLPKWCVFCFSTVLCCSAGWAVVLFLVVFSLGLGWRPILG